MNEMETLTKVRKLLERKAVITKDIKSIESDEYPTVNEIVLYNPVYLHHRSVEFYNKGRFYNKVKYLILAELNESLDKTNAEINSLIEFKGVGKS